MNRSKEAVLVTCERQFILEAIKERKRLDGRSVYDYRTITINTSDTTPGNVSVTLGGTRVLTCVSCEVVAPRPQRPTDGQLFFNVSLSPMASPYYEIGGRPSPLVVETERLLERCFKESRAIDTEGLCIIAGHKVWSIRVDIHVLNDCGNIIDCCTIAAITALKHFRRPDVTVVGEDATIHSVTEREPVPLSIHHIPLCITFGFYHLGEYLLVDPTHEEEAVIDGRLILAMNVHREICTLQMTGGVALSPDQIKRCTQIATVKVSEINELIKAALKGTSSTINTIKDLSILETETTEDTHCVDFTTNKGAELTSEEEPDIVILGDHTSELQVPLNKDELIEVLETTKTVPSWEQDDSEEETTMIVTGEQLGFTKKKENLVSNGTSKKTRSSKPKNKRGKRT